MLELLLSVLLFNASPVTLDGQSGSTAGTTSPNSDSGLVRIRCVSEAGIRFFRGVAIDVGGTRVDREIILTVAHGLPENPDSIHEECAVLGPDGSRSRITSAHFAPSGVLSENDWAVVTTPRLEGSFLRPVVLRTLDSDRAAPDLAGLPVRLPLLYAPSERNCDITGPSKLHDGAELFVHSCNAWPGLSGSPIIARVEGRNYVVGIHLGAQWSISLRGRISVARFIDETIEEAIRAQSAADLISMISDR